MLPYLAPYSVLLSGIEKKLLQSMLRKASTSGKKVDVSKSTTNNKDVSTSTEDLGKFNSSGYFAYKLIFLYPNDKG